MRISNRIILTSLIFVSAAGAKNMDELIVPKPEVNPAFQNEKPPYSESSLLEIFGELLSSEDGFLTKEKINDAFKISIQKSDLGKNSFHLPESTYSTTAYKNGYFDMSLIDYGEDKSSFSFGWGAPPGKENYPFSVSPQGYCVRSESLLHEVATKEWILKSKTVNQTFTSYLYKKGKGKLRILFNTVKDCMTNFRMTSNISN